MKWPTKTKKSKFGEVLESPEWDGNCHGCTKRILQTMVAQIGPYWICNDCIRDHFPNDKYSINQAAEILERLRGFKDVDIQ